jgi:hypothetical protein
LLAAARRNARHSTGPRSPAAKQHSKLNALKHGAYVSFENQRESMQALGEDPERFQALSEELKSAFAPGDALQERQVEDLAWLYWRRERLERAQEALRRRALQGIEEWQQRRRREMAGVTFEASRHELLDVTLGDSEDRGVELRKTLSYLGVIREEVQQGTYRRRQQAVLETLYEGTMGWRLALICQLLGRFCEALDLARKDANQEYVDSLRAAGLLGEPPGEGEQRELLHLLEEEMASLGEELADEEKAHEERAVIEREACLAPPSETWSLLVRQEGSLDRSIDRKVRILLRLRKEFADYAFNPGGKEGGGLSESLEAVLDGDSPEDRELRDMLKKSKLRERSGNVAENKGAGIEHGAESGNVDENTGGYLHDARMSLKGQGVTGGRATSGALSGVRI